jgi:hypothetical protein
MTFGAIKVEHVARLTVTREYVPIRRPRSHASHIRNPGSTCHITNSIRRAAGSRQPLPVPDRLTESMHGGTAECGG